VTAALAMILPAVSHAEDWPARPVKNTLSGGLADPTTIYSGGSEIISAHGTDLGALISGGTQLDYGLASGATVFAGWQVVEAGGTASATSRR
jgi:autotransporter passenger strand-loop-strand repeat protein